MARIARSLIGLLVVDNDLAHFAFVRCVRKRRSTHRSSDLIPGVIANAAQRYGVIAVSGPAARDWHIGFMVDLLFELHFLCPGWPRRIDPSFRITL